MKGRIYCSDGIECIKEEVAIKRAIKASKRDGKASIVVCDKYDYVGNRYAEVERINFVDGQKCN